jgi:hypothetical protein
MGMEQKVVFGPTGCPSWSGVDELLKRHGYPVQMRMIDGQLAFPDETPGDAWQELRLGTSGGMITVRRQEMAVLLVTWGNADEAMRQAWNLLTWAFAEASRGQVVDGDSGLSASEYRQRVSMPSAPQPSP